MDFDSIIRMPVSLQVAGQLRDRILAGEFVAGQALPTERELTQAFGVSRTSVREALRALEAQGFVASGPATSRTVVAPGLSAALREAVGNLLRLQQIPVDDLVEFRCVIERATVGRAAELRPQDALAEAHAAVNAMQDRTLGPEAFEKLDLRFHVALAAASGNQALHLVFLAVRDAIELYLLDRMRRHGNLQVGLDRLRREHAEILEAVGAGEGERAAELMAAHIRGFAHSWISDGVQAER